MKKDGFEIETNEPAVEEDPSKRFSDIKKPSKSKKSTVEFINETRRALDDIGEYTSSDFEDGLESLLEMEEDEELKDSLLSMGRKYARDNEASEEAGEIFKAFSPQETKLNSLLTTLSKDAVALEKDIEEMRMARTRNYARLNEMISTKAQYENTKLAVIKELSSIKKTQFELKAKLKDNSGSSDSYAAQSVIQSLFNVGPKELLNSVGGRERSSGSYEDDYDYDYSSDDTDSSYHESMIDAAASSGENVSDGDKFLKYENAGVEYVLERNKSDDSINIYAEDKDGNVVTDYPLPRDIPSLSFDINEKGGFALDQFSRRYKLRDIGDSEE